MVMFNYNFLLMNDIENIQFIYGAPFYNFCIIISTQLDLYFKCIFINQ